MDSADRGDRIAGSLSGRPGGLETDHGVTRRASGLTLIELLIALAILSMVTLLLAASSGGMRRAVEGFLSRDHRIGEPSVFLNELARDVESACDPFLPETPAFELSAGASTDSELWTWTFYTAKFEPGSEDPARAELLRLRYIARRGADGVTLGRTEQPVRGAVPATLPPEQKILTRLRGIAVQVSTGEIWTVSWPEKVEHPLPLPRRVRVRIEPEGENEPALTAEFLIPASMTVPSTLLRTASP